MSLNLGESVWERQYGRRPFAEVLSLRAYTFAVSGFTVMGMVVASIIAYLTMD